MRSLMRRDRFDRLTPFRGAMDRMLEDTFARPSLFEPFALGPALDVYETKDDVVVKAAIPGIKPEEIDIKVVGNSVTIKGEIKAEEEIERGDYIHRERRYGKFCRAVTLPGEVEPDKAKAEFENGVLTLTMPKSEESKPKSIKVKVS